MTRSPIVGILPLVGLLSGGCFLFPSKDAGTSPQSSASTSTDASAPGGLGPGGTDPDSAAGTHGGSGFRGPGPGGTEPTPPPVVTATAAAPATTASATPSAAASAAPALPTTIEVKSECPDTLQIFLGAKPKSAGTATSIAGRTTTTEPLDASGALTVWILDGKGEGVASAHAGATSKRIVIGVDCRSLRVE